MGRPRPEEREGHTEPWYWQEQGEEGSCCHCFMNGYNAIYPRLTTDPPQSRFDSERHREEVRALRKQMELRCQREEEMNDNPLLETP